MIISLTISINSYSQIFMDNGSYELLENDSLVNMPLSITQEHLGLVYNQNGDDVILIVENFGWKTDILVFQTNQNGLYIKNFELQEKTIIIKDSTFIKDVKIVSEIDSLKGFYQISPKNNSNSTDKQFKILSVYKNDTLISRLVFHDVKYSNKHLPTFSIIKTHLDLFSKMEYYIK